MEFHLRAEPDVSPIQMSTELFRLCNTPRGGTIEQSYLYFDGISAAGWRDICNQEDYFASFDGSQSLDLTAELILDHLKDTKYNKRALDIIGIGAGDARKEGKLVQSLLDLDPSLKVNCHLIDKSNPLLIAAHFYLNGIFANTGRVSVKESLADFWKLPSSELFSSKENRNTLRVGCMFGYTLGNLDGDLRFVRDSLSAFKSGDLFLVDVILGFAPHNDIEAIRCQDPRLGPNKGVWQQATETWLATTLQRYRINSSNILFENFLSTTTSSFPNTYTIEIHASVQNARKQVRFNMLRFHRYHQESFIGTIAKEGWRKLGGKTFGTNKSCLRYLFVKE